MHQPEYRDLLSGHFHQPWTYLHAIKDYSDMAAHLEAYPDIRAVLNFAPILLEGIADYRVQLDAHLREQRPLSDPLLAALTQGSIPRDADSRLKLAQWCLRANEDRVINRFAPYRELVDIIQSRESSYVEYLNDQYFHDLVVWYHLAWLGEMARRRDPTVKRLLEKSRGYSVEDRRQLIEVLGDAMRNLVPRYRRLADADQIELSTTPYAHPIMPLLIDFAAARESLPEVALPATPYVGGIERVRWHLETGLQVFEHTFGRRPAGCWPSEGGMSEHLLPLFSEYGFKWTASGQSVLSNSLELSGIEKCNGTWPHRPYRLGDTSLVGFFRDDGLSDAIGFTYSDWHGEDAVADLVRHLEQIAAKVESPASHVVSIIMDGENAWEHYPENGAYFLDHLYEALSDHPRLVTTTYSELLARGTQADVLPRLCAGSWVYGTFSTWIGDPDKNRAWEILAASKEAFDEVMSNAELSATKRRQLQRQLAVCEGSDWFWWFGDYNPVESIDDFSALFRLHIRNLHEMLDRPAPVGLDVSFGSGGDAEHGGAMRRGSSG